MKKAYVVVVVFVAALACAAQFSPAPVDQAKSVAVSQAADAILQRLHATLDFRSLTADIIADEAARHREYPGEFMLFPTPRMSKALLNQTDDATLRRKLAADRNLYYLTFAMLQAPPERLSESEPLVKKLPADFAKAARKSKYLKNFAGVSQNTTLVSAAELTDYLAEADTLLALLRRNLPPDKLASPAFAAAAATSSGKPDVNALADIMGYNRVYTIGRESLLLVFADTDSGLKLVTVAPAGQ